MSDIDQPFSENMELEEEKMNQQHSNPCPDMNQILEKYEKHEKCKKMEKNSPLILQPEHPMMERFQAVFKSHLVRQLDRLGTKNFEMVTDIKTTQKEREMYGIDLYSLQQEVYKQQTFLEEFQNEIEKMMQSREEMEVILIADKNKWKDKVDNLNKEKKNEINFNTELNKLSALKKQFEMWEHEIDSELTVSQRIAEKTRADRRMLFEEKRQMDMYLLKLLAEVNRFDSELSLLNTEIEVKLEEGERLNQTLADANADLQALAFEQKRLFRAWNSIIVIMSQRDQVYTHILKDLSECEEGFRSLGQEIESYKRSGDVEMRRNERLSIQINSLYDDVQHSNKQLDNQIEKKMLLEERITSVLAMTQQTEKDLLRAKVEYRVKETEYSGLRLQLGKKIKDKSSVEEEILYLLQDVVTNDKASGHVKKLFDDLRKQTRLKEALIVECENKLAKLMLQIEEEKGSVARNKDILDEMNKDLSLKEQELKRNDDIISKFPAILSGKQNDIMSLNKKIDKLMSDTGMVKLGQHPLELRITELQHLLQDLQDKNDKLQSYWLLQQNNNVKIAVHRTQQLKEINLLRKQVVILDQRTLKIEAEVDHEQKTDSDLTRSVNYLQKQLENLNASLINRRDYKYNLDKGNVIVQTMYTTALKEAETEILQIQSDIYQCEKDLNDLEKTMLEVQREIVAWDKKIKLTLETMENIKKEKQTDGEVGQMKIEIHRMEVRESQLKRAEEKLVNDLELCVLRRDAITDVAAVRDKKTTDGFSNTKYNMQKKLDEMKNKVKKINNDARLSDKDISETEDYQQYLLNGMNEKTEHVRLLNEQCSKQNKQLQDFQLKKQQNLELLVRRQKKCKLYTNVKTGKHRLLYRNELVLENEIQTQKAMNSNLISVIESLIDHFPFHRFHLVKIFNTLSSTSS